jgi:hypothetical protein
MKIIAIAAILGTTIFMVGPAFAQDRGSSSIDKKTDTAVHHRVVRHRVTYRRTYKTDQEEHGATGDLNRQYRGVSGSDVH